MPLHMLVVDDSLTIRKLVELTFRGKDVEVTFAASGSEGYAKAIGRTPDIVLLDVVLPDMKGPELCRRLYQTAETANVPVVVMSAKTSGLQELFRGLPTVVGFLVKPFAAPTLIETVSKATQSRPTAAVPAPSSPSIGFAYPPPAMLPRREAIAIPVELRSERPAPMAVMTAPSGALFQGSMANLELEEVLGMTLALPRSVELLVKSPERTTHVYARKGEILMATTTDPQVGLRDLPIDLARVSSSVMARAQREQAQSGKPALVTLAEHGQLPSCDLSHMLFEQGRRVLLETSSRKDGTFECVERASFPLYVDAYHRTITPLQLRLDLRRQRSPSSPPQSEAVYSRAPNFSRTLSQIELTVSERRAVQHVDGTSHVGSIARRAGLSVVEVSDVLDRLAGVGLVARGALFPEEPPSMSRMRRALVFEPDVEGFTSALERLLQKRAESYEVIPVKEDADVLATIRRTRPWLVVVNATAFGGAVTQAARAVRSGSDQREMRLIAVLERPSDAESAALAVAGFDAVLTKPVSYLEIERVVSL